MPRDKRFLELDRLITGGFGDSTIGSKQWDSSVRILTVRRESNNIDDQIRSMGFRRITRASLALPHAHSWRTRGRERDGRRKLFCRICKTIKLEGDSRSALKRLKITRLLEEGALSVRQIAREVPCSTSTILSVKRSLTNAIPQASRKGESNPAAKITAKQAAHIRRLLRSGESQRTIARAFDISQSTVSQIARGKIWSEGTVPLRAGE